MQHVKKMALVPQMMVDRMMEAQREQQQLTSNTPIVQLSLLDKELKSILESAMPSDIKAKEYGKVLQHYSTLRSKEIFTPLSVVDVPVKPDLLTGLAPTYINKGKMLVQSIANNPDLQWNDKNEIIYKGRHIAGSNLVDLIHTYAKPKSSQKPVGWRLFGRALIDNNTPRIALANTELVNKIDEPLTPHRPEPTKLKRLDPGAPLRTTKPRVVKEQPPWRKY